MRIGYADPPYPGCAHLYKDHPDFGGEVDHAALIDRLETEFDGWVLHTSSVAIPLIAPLLPAGSRWMSWVKPFAAFKKNVSVAYAWEPVIVKSARKPVVSGRMVMRDWISCPMTMQRGLTGAKPEKVCHWAFEMVGAEPGDELIDIFPGTGAVSQAWNTWRRQIDIPLTDSSLSSSPFRAGELFKVVNAEKGEPPNEVRSADVAVPGSHSPAGSYSGQCTGRNQPST